VRRNLLVRAMYYTAVHSFCFLSSMSRSECNPVVSYLKTAILRVCSILWFEKKLMVVSVLMGFRKMSLLVLDGFRIRSRFKKFICSLFSCLTLNFVCLCI
jgi:hypothetical protein